MDTQVKPDGAVSIGAAVDLNEVRALCRRTVRERQLHGMSALAVLASQLDHWSGNQARPISLTLQQREVLRELTTDFLSSSKLLHFSLLC